MYSVCTYRFATAMRLGFLFPVASAFAWVAFAAWLVAFAGLARSLVSGFAPPRRTEQA